MTPDLLERALKSLELFKFKNDGKYLKQGICPHCGKKELFSDATAPWLIKCNRIKECQFEIHLKDHAPDIFSNFSKRYPITPEDPLATAKAYLKEARGFDLGRLIGLYTQESYFDHKLNKGSSTVRFDLGQGAYWERLIDDAHQFSAKARFSRRTSDTDGYKGRWWCHPSIHLESVTDLWIVEGVFDAIALLHHDIQAVSVMTCNNFPDSALNDLKKINHRCRLVFALDNDAAGKDAIKKMVKKAREMGFSVSAALPPAGKKKQDWNDLHLVNRLSIDDIEKYRYYGKLHIAQSPLEKARVIFNQKERTLIQFDFDNRVYEFKLDIEKYNKARDENDDQDEALQQSGTLVELMNCQPIPLYFMRNEVTDESWYFFAVYKGDHVYKNTFTSSQIAGAAEFKKRIFDVAPGAHFDMTTQQLDKYLRYKKERIQVVKTINYTGYTKEHGCYIFGDVAVKNGLIYELNQEDFFEMGNLAIKGLSRSLDLSINTDMRDYSKHWTRLIEKCFGAKGMVVLAWWFGSLFAEQIRMINASYPFMELVGEPGSGKSTLIQFLWKLCGRDYEGFDPSKSTAAARARNFAQVSNLPVVLIEGDRDDASHSKRFDFDELKTAYNGRALRATGVKNSGNDTHEPPFKGAIMISQNADVMASDAILERICYVHFDCAAQNAESKAAAETLERMDMSIVSQFLLMATQNEAQIINIIKSKTIAYETELEETYRKKGTALKPRLIKNHAQIKACADALASVIELHPKTLELLHAQLELMALERQQAINADVPIVAEFWDAFEWLHGLNPMINHARDESTFIAINLNQFVEIANECKQQIPQLTELKRMLKSSRKHRFKEVKAIHSPHINRTIKCWIFEK